MMGQRSNAICLHADGGPGDEASGNVNGPWH